MTDFDWLQLRLTSTDLSDGVIFTIDFVNGSEEHQTLRFSENESEAARRSLKIRMGDLVLSPVEYELINRKPDGDLPSIPIAAAQAHRFTLTGKWEKGVLRFGSTGYVVKPGSYVVAFNYGRAESNSLMWNVK